MLCHIYKNKTVCGLPRFIGRNTSGVNVNNLLVRNKNNTNEFEGKNFPFQRFHDYIRDMLVPFFTTRTLQNSSNNVIKWKADELTACPDGGQHFMDPYYVDQNSDERKRQVMEILRATINSLSKNTETMAFLYLHFTKY